MTHLIWFNPSLNDLFINQSDLILNGLVVKVISSLDGKIFSEFLA